MLIRMSMQASNPAPRRPPLTLLAERELLRHKRQHKGTSDSKGKQRNVYDANALFPPIEYSSTRKKLGQITIDGTLRKVLCYEYAIPCASQQFSFGALHQVIPKGTGGYHHGTKH